MAFKNQGGSHLAIKGRVHQICTPIRIDSQCCARTKEGWEGEDVCGFQGLEQGMP